MPRYFIEVSYKGTGYSGFQVQANANSIQAEIEKCFQIFYKEGFELTGSSRTDTGVHALQNFFHFDSLERSYQQDLYHLNAILPRDIVIKCIFQVAAKAHCRFDAKSRTYRYFIYKGKDPFLEDRAYYYPYVIDMDLMQQAASIVLGNHDFTTFSKRNTQSKNFICNVFESNWQKEGSTLFYQVTGNRFLRGMVRGLVGTLLRVGTGKITVDEFRVIFESKDCGNADFSVPAQGLFLMGVNYLK